MVGSRSEAAGGASSTLVLGSLVQSGLLSKFDKTGTWTGLHRLKNHEKLVQCGFGQFFVVERPVSTSFSLNWLKTG